MSVAELWQDMYRDAIRREAQLREEKHQLQMRLIRLESQRFSMLMDLELAIGPLDNASPRFAQVVRAHIQHWKNTYETQTSTVRPFRQAATDSQPDPGSENRQTGVPVGASEGMPESTGREACVSTDVPG